MIHKALNSDATTSGWRATAAKIATGVAATIILVASVVFSLIAVAIIAIVILLVGLYFWWRTRSLRRHLQAQMEAATRNEGVVIEGEVVRNDAPGRNRRASRTGQIIDAVSTRRS